MSGSVGKSAQESAERHAIALMNEQIKLRANAFDRASTAVFTIGILAPAANYLYGPGINMPVNNLLDWFALWLSAAVVLHMIAGFLLGGLAYVEP